MDRTPPDRDAVFAELRREDWDTDVAVVALHIDRLRAEFAPDAEPLYLDNAAQLIDAGYFTAAEFRSAAMRSAYFYSRAKRRFILPPQRRDQ